MSIPNKFLVFSSRNDGAVAHGARQNHMHNLLLYTSLVRVCPRVQAHFDIAKRRYIPDGMCEVRHPIPS